MLLLSAEAAREVILLQHIANGVIIDSRTVQIAPDVVIAPGAVILAGTILRGRTVIGAGCIIGPNTLIEDSIVDEGSTVNASQVYSSHIGPHNNIGPFTHVRVNTVTAYGVHLGAYVETKNSNFARGNTVSHLTYIGDSDVGKYCNFGCGTVTCNYDGKDKFRTTIGDYCDSVGFQQVPEFLRENPLRTAGLSTEQNENMIDGVITILSTVSSSLHIPAELHAFTCR